MKKLLFGVFLSGALITPCQQALAGPFSDLRSQGPICFEKSYTAQHLNSHPKQTVKRMQHKFYMSSDWDGINLQIKADILRPQRNGPALPKPYKTQMSCRLDSESNSIESLKCGIDCDGGTAEVFYDVSQTASGVTNIKFVNHGFVMYGGCGDEVDEADSIWLKPLKDGDDIFNLKRTPCK